MVLLIAYLTGIIMGVLLLIVYMITRMLSSDGWDKSNITNALRLLSHVVMHPEDFGKMWYVKKGPHLQSIVLAAQPFWYIDKDELSEVVKTRPPK